MNRTITIVLALAALAPCMAQAVDLPAKALRDRWAAEDEASRIARQAEAAALRDSLRLVVVPFIEGKDLRESERRQNDFRARYNSVVRDLTNGGGPISSGPEILNGMLLAEENAKAFPPELRRSAPAPSASVSATAAKAKAPMIIIVGGKVFSSSAPAVEE